MVRWYHLRRSSHVLGASHRVQSRPNNRQFHGGLTRITPSSSAFITCNNKRTNHENHSLRYFQCTSTQYKSSSSKSNPKEESSLSHDERMAKVVETSKVIEEGAHDEFTEWVPPNRPLPGDKGAIGSPAMVESSKKKKKKKKQVSPREVGSEDFMTGTQQQQQQHQAQPDFRFAYPHEMVLATDDAEASEKENRYDYEDVKEDEEDEAAVLLEDYEDSLDDHEKDFQPMMMDDSDNSETAPIGGPDWLRNRRQALDMLKPDEASTFRDRNMDLPVKKHTLLSEVEIITCLENCGATDFTTILDNKEPRKLGGADGMILCNVSNHMHCRLAALTLARQLKRRKLAEKLVVGAKLGVEGIEDPENDWLAVDCKNWHVHIMIPITREHLSIEKIWSGEDPLFSLDVNDDDAVDAYISEHPVPDGYQPRGSKSDDLARTLANLQKNRYLAKHQSVVEVAKKKRVKKKRKNAGRQA